MSFGQPDANTGPSEAGALPLEESLEAAALRGDRRAIDALWRLHRRWVAAVLLAYKPRSEDLEDLLQEVAMTMLTKIHTVREAGSIRAWLRTVAINIARAAGRSERARPVQRLEREHCEALPDDRTSRPAGLLPSSSAAHDGLESALGIMNDEAQRMMRLCENLPEGYREPLLLKAVHGMRTRQISRILGLPEATVDTRISRARRMLRELAGVETGRRQVPDGIEGDERTAGFRLNGLKEATNIKWRRGRETPVA